MHSNRVLLRYSLCNKSSMKTSLLWVFFQYSVLQHKTCFEPGCVTGEISIWNMWKMSKTHSKSSIRTITSLFNDVSYKLQQSPLASTFIARVRTLLLLPQLQLSLYILNNTSYKMVRLQTAFCYLHITLFTHRWTSPSFHSWTCWATTGGRSTGRRDFFHLMNCEFFPFAFYFSFHTFLQPESESSVQFTEERESPPAFP